MNQAHKRLLLRQATSRPQNSAGLQLKAQAWKELLSHATVANEEAVRDHLLDVIDRAELIGTARAQAAASMAARLLDKIEGEPEVQNEALWVDAPDPDQALELLPLLLPSQLAFEAGWHHPTFDSGRGRDLLRRTDAVMRAEDPLEAADEALKVARGRRPAYLRD
jgi:hypothetical protein